MAKRKVHYLEKVRISEVSLVSRPANKLARVLLVKADQTLEEDDVTIISKSDALAALQAKAQEFRKSNPGLSREQAFDRVYKDRANADLVTAYRNGTGPSVTTSREPAPRKVAKATTAYDALVQKAVAFQKTQSGVSFEKAFATIYRDRENAGLVQQHIKEQLA